MQNSHPCSQKQALNTNTLHMLLEKDISSTFRWDILPVSESVAIWSGRALPFLSRKTHLRFVLLCIPSGSLIRGPSPFSFSLSQFGNISLCNPLAGFPDLSMINLRNCLANFALIGLSNKNQYFYSILMCEIMKL